MYALSHLISHKRLDLDLLYEIMKSAQYSFGISISLFNDKNTKLKGFGNGHEFFSQYPEIHKEYLQFIQEKRSNISTPIFFESSFKVCYLTFLLIHEEKYYGFIALGPFMKNSLTEHQLNQIIQNQKLPLSDRNHFKLLFSRIPIISKIRLFHIEKAFIALLESSTRINDRSNSPTEIDDSPQEYSFNNSIPIDNHKTPTSFISHDFELLFLDKVATGDIEQVFTLYSEHIRPLFSSHSSSDFIDDQFNAIIINTLLSRRVINASVDADYAFRLFHQYVTAIKEASTLNELTLILEDMINKYTNSVLHIDSISHVGVIKKASKYVHNHLSEAIRLQEVADYIGLSPNYFSSLFKKEMNLAFADYVNHIRIKESQYLLKTTDQSILDIALSVGFNNQNYFTTIFKKVTGITPKQYRIKT